MEILKFTLSGLGATFTRPSFNSIITTYSHIHKISVLGILGAVIGIEKNNYIEGDLPSFYKELNSLEVSIVPSDITFYKKRDTITDTTGFSNREANFIGVYDTLINPKWDIYIYSNGNRHYEEIKKSLLNKDSYYYPYLGRNHWFANIDDVKVLQGELVNEADNIDGLFISKNIELDIEEDDDFDDNHICFQEYMPVSFRKDFVQYIEENLTITNRKVLNTNVPLLSCDNKILYLI